MSLALYGHPFPACTQKVLLALQKNGTPFAFRSSGPDTQQRTEEWLRRWPLHMFPRLPDADRQADATRTIIEYLQLAYPGPVRRLPVQRLWLVGHLADKP